MDAREIAAAAAESLATGGGRYTTGEGIVLGFRNVPPLAVRECALQVPKPVAPKVWIESKQREEENPADPDYLKAVDQHSTQVYEAVGLLALMLGTECVSVPNGMDAPGDEAWVEQLRAAGVAADVSSAYRRYHSWLTLYALRSNEDIAKVTIRAIAMAGLTDREVSQAVDSFRSQP